jgi:hypothetical protein
VHQNPGHAGVGRADGGSIAVCGWAELQVLAMLRTVGPVVEVGFLVAAVCGWRESVVRVHDGFDEYLVSFCALSASRRSLLVLTTNEGRQLAGLGQEYHLLA